MKILILGPILFASIALPATPLKVLSLNLHGHHPTNRPLRFRKTKKGYSAQSSHLHFFTLDEIRNGHAQQVQGLAKDIALLRPDILAFQEVGSGPYLAEKDCQDFRDQALAGEGNSVYSIQRELLSKGQRYNSYVACRGNVGWKTDANTFRQRSVYRRENGRYQKLFGAGDNPYPQGLLIEGMGFLVSQKIQVNQHFIESLSFNSNNEKVFFHALDISVNKSNKDLLVLNFHLGHKITHIEQAIAIRKWIQAKMNRKAYHRVLLLGDFNARDSHPPLGEITLFPWLIKSSHPPLNYDFSNQNTHDYLDLSAKLYTLNRSNYKPWATIKNPTDEKNRIKEIQTNFSRLFQRGRIRPFFETQRGNNFECLSMPKLDSFCSKAGLIDFIFNSHRDLVKGSYLYQKHNWTETQGSYSDHPAVYSEIHI